MASRHHLSFPMTRLSRDIKDKSQVQNLKNRVRVGPPISTKKVANNLTYSEMGQMIAENRMIFPHISR